MFREMRRSKQMISEEVCKKVLREANRGVVSVIGDDGYPYGIPMDFIYDENENRLYFHSAKEGHKIEAIRANDKVCFTTWDEGYKVDGNWEWNLNSVIVFGRATLIEDTQTTHDRVRKIAEKYYPDMAEADDLLERAMPRIQLWTIDIEYMSGKLVNEK